MPHVVIKWVTPRRSFTPPGFYKHFSFPFPRIWWGNKKIPTKFRLAELARAADKGMAVLDSKSLFGGQGVEPHGVPFAPEREGQEHLGALAGVISDNSSDYKLRQRRQKATSKTATFRQVYYQSMLLRFVRICLAVGI